MILSNPDSLNLQLPPLEQVVPNLEKRYAFQLKDSFNMDEVKDFVKYVGTRHFAYQVLNYYEFIPELDSVQVETDHEVFANQDNQISGRKQDVHRFYCKIRGKLVNPYSKENNGPKEISDLQYDFVVTFIDFPDVNRVGTINTEDLKFDNPLADFFGRSVFAVTIQDYAKFTNAMTFKRNFTAFPAEQHKDTFEDIIKKQRDLFLTRDQTLDHLKNRVCRRTGQNGLALLDPQWSLTK